MKSIVICKRSDRRNIICQCQYLIVSSIPVFQMAQQIICNMRCRGSTSTISAHKNIFVCFNRLGRNFVTVSIYCLSSVDRLSISLFTICSKSQSILFLLDSFEISSKCYSYVLILILYLFVHLVNIYFYSSFISSIFHISTYLFLFSFSNKLLNMFDMALIDTLLIDFNF